MIRMMDQPSIRPAVPNDGTWPQYYDRPSPAPLTDRILPGLVTLLGEEDCLFFKYFPFLFRIQVPRHNCCSYSHSEMLSPSHSPLSILCCRTQLRMDSPVIPRSRATSLKYSDRFLSPGVCLPLNIPAFDCAYKPLLMLYESISASHYVIL